MKRQRNLHNFMALSVLRACLEFSMNGGMVMTRFLVSVVVALALLTSGVVVTHSSMVGTAYADGGGE